MKRLIGVATAALLLSVPLTAAAETLDECAAELRRSLGGGQGTLKDWYPPCRVLEAERRRAEEATERHRKAGSQNPAKAAQLDIQLQNCLNVSSPTWEGERVSRSWWGAHCRWFTGQPGAERPPSP